MDTSTKSSVTNSRRRKRRRVQARGRILRGPRTQNHVLQAFEGLNELYPRCTHQQTQAERMGDSRCRQTGRPSARMWSSLSDEVLAIWRLLSRGVRERRLDPAELEDAYRHFLHVKTTWAKYASQSTPHDVINKTIGHLRALLIACGPHQ